MPQTLQINIKSAIFDRERLLTVHPAYIEFDDKESVSSSPVKFFSNDIVFVQTWCTMGEWFYCRKNLLY